MKEDYYLVFLVDGKTYDIYGYEDVKKNDFHKFDIGAKLAAGVKLKPQLTMFWELSNSIPFSHARSPRWSYLRTKQRQI